MLTDRDVFVVRAEGRVLDAPWVHQLEARFAQHDASEALYVLDAAEVEDITPRALAALLELGERRANLALAGLCRHALLLAVQVGLAERWRIYVTAHAARRACTPNTRPRALIWEVPGQSGAGGLDLAGRPLVIRQLQFLRDLGIEDVVVEVSDGPQAAQRAKHLLGSDPLCENLVVIPSAAPLGMEELARRAGIPPDELFLSLPADLALHAALDIHVARPTAFEIACPPEVHEASVRVEMRTPTVGAEAPPKRVTGWGARIRHHESAHALACAALQGNAPGLMIHAAEVRPGVWLARGARVAPDAQLLPPVFIGSEARVLSKAQVGPRAILGQASVVERDAVVTESSVEPGTLVGEGTRISGAHAEPHGMISFADLSYMPVSDPLVLSPRAPHTTAWSSRLIALTLCLLLALPWLLGTSIQRLFGRRSVRVLKTPRGYLHLGQSGLSLVDLPPSLCDVVLGRRDLVGVSDPQALERACTHDHGYLRPGAFDLSAAMAPGASTSTLLRMWRWYRAHKSLALDRALWRQRASRAGKKSSAITSSYADA